MSPNTERGCALVTGASRGIGAETARVLAKDGWAVAVNYRSDKAGAEAVAKEIQDAGGKAVVVQGDVSEPEAAAAIIKEAEEALGCPVLVLVNNAGVTRDGLALTISDESWDKVVDTNLTAAFRMTRGALRGMLKARFGRVVNVASIVGPRANVGQANYAASKAGLIGLTKTIAAEVARKGVTVNAVAPGFIETEMTTEVLDGIVDAIPARRPGTTAEVAACVRFLVSDEASYVTGSTVYVDGGLSA